MQVTLNLDVANVGETVGELLSSLSQEKKNEIAREVFVKILDEKFGLEREVFEEEVITSLLSSGSRYLNREDARTSYEFRQRMEGFKPLREVLLKATYRQVHVQLTSDIKEVVQKSKETKDLIKTVSEDLKAQLPSIIRDAMVMYFASQMTTIMEATARSLMQSQNAESLTNSIIERLNR